MKTTKVKSEAAVVVKSLAHYARRSSYSKLDGTVTGLEVIFTGDYVQ